MRRVPMVERPGWLSTVEAQGLAYAVECQRDGSVRPYWHEGHAYELTEPEVDYLDDVTGHLHRMCVEASRHVLADDRLWASLCLPEQARHLLDWSLRNEQAWTLYGRFDLAWDPDGGPAKMLEYNADTPAGLVEAAVCQWGWLEDRLPGNDQWNLLHELLVKRWAVLGACIPGGTVHLAVGQDEPTEDWCTVAYLSDTATEAGLQVVRTTMESIGWDERRRRFIGPRSDRDDIGAAFKMYPWEWMLDEAFGEHILDGYTGTRWIEPAWKALAGSKTLLVALWECFPGNDFLLPAQLDEPGPWMGYVRKPVYGWEGAGVEVVTPDFRYGLDPKHTAGQRNVYQAYHPIRRFDGAQPILGTWVIGGRPAGLGIRESDGHVTDTGARFVPHYMTTPRSTPEQVAAWVGGEG
ncbi:MAG TPA: glutathionylspermidine synthase family protein [Kineosporiaceae bacterium]|nr:glutathionylspermidine synthase family protein [Kineosporiaceae bacterium]